MVKDNDLVIKTVNLFMACCFVLGVSIYYLLPVIEAVMPLAGLLGLGLTTGGIAIAVYYGLAMILYMACDNSDNSFLKRATKKYLFQPSQNIITNIFFNFLNLLIYPYVVIIAAAKSLTEAKYQDWRQYPYRIFLKTIFYFIFSPLYFPVKFVLYLKSNIASAKGENITTVITSDGRKYVWGGEKSNVLVPPKNRQGALSSVKVWTLSKPDENHSKKLEL